MISAELSIDEIKSKDKVDLIVLWWTDDDHGEFETKQLDSCWTAKQYG